MRVLSKKHPNNRQWDKSNFLGGGGDFNMNLLHFSHNKKAQGFVNLLFWFSIISTTNKPTRVSIDFITAIGHIITNSILDCDFKIGKSGKWTDLAHSIKIFKQFLLLTRKQKCLKKYYIFTMKKKLWPTLQKS